MRNLLRSQHIKTTVKCDGNNFSPKFHVQFPVWREGSVKHQHHRQDKAGKGQLWTLWVSRGWRCWNIKRKPKPNLEEGPVPDLIMRISSWKCMNRTKVLVLLQWASLQKAEWIPMPWQEEDKAPPGPDLTPWASQMICSSLCGLLPNAWQDLCTAILSRSSSALSHFNVPEFKAAAPLQCGLGPAQTCLRVVVLTNVPLIENSP